MKSHMTRAATALALTVFAAACDNGNITDINHSPNSPTTVTPQFLFPNAVTNLVGTIRGGSLDLTLASLWAQQMAMDRFTDEDRYSIRPANINGYWSGFYAGGLEDLATILQQNKPEDVPNLVGPALVMKSFTFGAMTDIWGDIPYSEANLGDVTKPPKYDRQQDIYTGIDADLKAASTMLVAGAKSYGAADLIYGGGASSWQNWQKFANSLRLRYAIRLSKVDPATAQTRAAEAVAAGVFTSNADNALLAYPGDGTNNSPIWSNFQTRDDQHVSKTLIDILKSLYISTSGADTTFDPRLAIYADPIISSPTKPLYVGAPNGLQDDDAIAIGINNTSRLGAVWRQPATKAILATYAEVLFNQAEAAARGWITGDPAQLYNAGITASMQFNKVPDDVTAAYIASPRVAYNPATGLDQIALQRWIALFQEGIEAYSEYRRTNVPDLQAGPAVITNPSIVARRLTYPLSEQSFNNTNLQAAISAQGGADLTGRVWWDKP
jgi:hypothetical protein